MTNIIKQGVSQVIMGGG